MNSENTTSQLRARITRNGSRGHAQALGIDGAPSKNTRRRVMAILRMSSMYVVFGRRARLGAIGAGRIAASLGAASMLFNATLVFGADGGGLQYSGSSPLQSNASTAGATSGAQASDVGIAMSADGDCSTLAPSGTASNYQFIFGVIIVYIPKTKV